MSYFLFKIYTNTNSDYKVAQGAIEGGAEACSLQVAQDDRPSNDGIRSKRNWYNSDYKVAQGATEGGAEACSLQVAQDDRPSKVGQWGQWICHYLILLLIGFWGLPPSWGSPIPTQMNSADRLKALEVLGLGSSMKLLSSPAPLGGYSGVEVGITSETISLEDLRRMGNRDSTLQEYNFNSISVGKGFYQNIDLFLSFTPTLQKNSLISFGGMLRWNFFNAENFPASLSFLAHSSSSNYSDLVATSTVGSDLVVSVNMEELSLYFGAGKVRAIGTFFGGKSADSSTGVTTQTGITDSGFTEHTDIIESHSIIGLMFRMDRYFLDLQIDRFTQSFYSGKIGLRF